MGMKKICVAGGGMMGRQIALNAAISGYSVTITDNNPDVLKDVKQWEQEYLAGRIKKGALTDEDVQQIMERFQIVSELSEAATGADLVIEAILEVMEVKITFFKCLAQYITDDTIVVTNSSRMVSSLFKDYVPNSARLANMHYFSPALVMKLVEIVKGSHTSDETAQKLVEFAKSVGKTPILLCKEVDGFVVNRVIDGIYDASFELVESGVCTPQDVDIAMELGCNHKMGPFRIMDFTGVDLLYLQRERQYAETGIKPAGYDILKGMYERGEFGQKSGKGFYDHTEK